MTKKADPLKSLTNTQEDETPTSPAIVRELAPSPPKTPDQERLIDLWHTTYRTIIDQIFSRGLAYYSSKEKLLQSELELAVIRSDDAVKAYIRVRNATPDPIFALVQGWYKEMDKDNPLA